MSSKILREFIDKNVVVEYFHDIHRDKYIATLKDVYVMHKTIMGKLCSRGSTREEAISELLKRLKGKHIYFKR